eukprot:m.55829 g.55829  ORF g.55829 m.55829 type:complete len:401 (+) comp7634_c0_seq1:221-1423(+)
MSRASVGSTASRFEAQRQAAAMVSVGPTSATSSTVSRGSFARPQPQWTAPLATVTTPMYNNDDAAVYRTRPEHRPSLDIVDETIGYNDDNDDTAGQYPGPGNDPGQSDGYPVGDMMLPEETDELEDSTMQAGLVDTLPFDQLHTHDTHDIPVDVPSDIEEDEEDHGSTTTDEQPPPLVPRANSTPAMASLSPSHAHRGQGDGRGSVSPIRRAKTKTPTVRLQNPERLRPRQPVILKRTDKRAMSKTEFAIRSVHGKEKAWEELGRLEKEPYSQKALDRAQRMTTREQIELEDEPTFVKPSALKELPPERKRAIERLAKPRQVKQQEKTFSFKPEISKPPSKSPTRRTTRKPAFDPSEYARKRRQQIEIAKIARWQPSQWSPLPSTCYKPAADARHDGEWD